MAVEALAAMRDGQGVGRVDDAMLALSAALVAQRYGSNELARQVLPELERAPVLLEVPSVRELATVVRAASIRLDGQPKQAAELLQPLITGNERYQTRVELLAAHLGARQYELALEHARWLQRRRGLAYIEAGCGQCLQTLNVADSNEAARVEVRIRAALQGAGTGASAAR